MKNDDRRPLTADKDQTCKTEDQRPNIEPEIRRKMDTEVYRTVEQQIDRT